MALAPLIVVQGGHHGRHDDQVDPLSQAINWAATRATGATGATGAIHVSVPDHTRSEAPSS
jgi:hypothetical protein